MAAACRALWAQQAKKIPVGPGLTDAEIDRVAAEVGVALPAQLEFLLRSGYPTGGSWHEWRADPAGVVKYGRARLRKTLEFDVEHNDGYWVAGWGARPADLHLAIERAWRWCAPGRH